MRSLSSSKMQMREAHGPATGVCCIVWDREGEHLITSGPDSRILIHELSAAAAPGDPPTVLQHHRAAVTALALAPGGKRLASGSADHSVKLFTYPDGEFQSNVTRFTLPIRSIAFSVTGGLLAAAGEDDGIKLINTIDSSIVRVLKGHSAPVISLAFDPNNEFLASAGSDGTVMCWSLSSGKRVQTFYHAAPNADLNNSGLNGIAWHPKGDVLAVPGRKNDVVMYDRDTGEKTFSLKGGHSASVGFLAWSPNGKYLATSAGDNQVILWDVAKRQDFDCQKFDSQICSLAWKPEGNALAVIDLDGKFGVWEPVIPSHMTLPSDNSSAALALEREDLLHFSDDDSEQSDQPSDRECSLSPKAGTEQLQEQRASKWSSSLKAPEGHLHSKSKVVEAVTDIEGSHRKQFSSLQNLPDMQSPFQSGSTQQNSGKRHFLSYNLIGSISSCQNEGLSHVEVEFHDTGRGVRVPSMTDYFGFTMAAMNETGSVFAAPRNGEKNPSTILYRPFSSWANNSEWSMRFAPEENVRAVAVGSGWVAASTSLDLLRIFSEGGLQRFVLSLAGPVITMAGHGQLLAVVTHASGPFLCGQQVMNIMVLNLLKRNKVMEGRLPLSPGAHLTWLGFSDSGFLTTYDSKGLLRVYSTEYDGCWIPVFSASKEQKSENESLWMVGLNSTQVFCVICKLPEKQPQVSPKPILSVFNLSLPLAYSDLGADDLENEYLLGSWHLAQSRRKADEAACEGEEENQDEEDVLRLEANLDRCLLRLIAAACKGDKLVKAVELAKMLSLNKSWKGAIKLVSAMRLPALAERLSAILEEKMLQELSQRAVLQGGEKFGSGLAHRSAPNTSLSSDDLNLCSTPSSEKSLPKVSTPFLENFPPAKVSVRHTFSKPPSSVPQNVMIDNKQVLETGKSSQKVASRSVDADRNNSDVEEQDPSTLSAKDNCVQRPSNPFARSSGASTNLEGQSGVSILQSLKRMQGSDIEMKRKEVQSTSATLNLKPAKLAKTAT